jgi:glycosyltransferase involved in cell wall biosynthesis
MEIGERIGDSQVLDALKRGAAGGEGVGRLRGQGGGEIIDGGVETVHTNHSGDEPQPVGLGCRDPAPGHHQFERPLRGKPLEEDDRHHVGPDSDVDLGSSENGVFGSDDEVTSKGEAHAAGEGVPADSGNGRLGEGGEILEDRRQLAPSFVQAGCGRPALRAASGRRVRTDEVRAGREGAVAGPGEDDYTDRLVGAGCREGRAETGKHGCVEGVAPIRTVDSDTAHRPVHLVDHIVGHLRHDTGRYRPGMVPPRTVDSRWLGELPKQVAIVSYRLGGTDGVSIEASKWQRAFESLGAVVTTVAGAGAADHVIRGLGAGFGRGATEPPVTPGIPESDGAPPGADRLTALLEAALDGADLVIVENCCSLPLDPEPCRVLARLLAGRPAVMHHHDLAWQRPQFRDCPGPPDDPAWWHVTINEHSRLELAARGIKAVTFYNCFDPDPVEGDRSATRSALGVGAGETLVVQPTRALARKNVAGGLLFAEALRATYWLLGPAEDGYDDELGRLLERTSGRVRSIVGRPESGRVEDAYAAADVVVLPSTSEGFGNPSVESALHRRPLAIGDYPVARELRRFGFSWFDVTEPERVARFLAHPDLAVLDRNEQVAKARFSTRDLPARLGNLVTGW